MSGPPSHGHRTHVCTAFGHSTCVTCCSLQDLPWLTITAAGTWVILQLNPGHTAGAATLSSPCVLPPWLHRCYCCRRGQTPVIAAIEARIAEWTRLPPDHGEPIQVLRYQNGQKYDAHWVSTLAASTRRGEPCVHWACPDCAFAGSAVSASAAAPAGPPIGSV
jgi:hypothetical protein